MLLTWIKHVLSTTEITVYLISVNLQLNYMYNQPEISKPLGIKMIIQN